MDADASARLGLPYLAAAQLQKHVTLNTALTRLDALVQCAVVSRRMTSPPSSPPDGALFILPAGAAGAGWAGQVEGVLMRAEGGGWTVVPVADGTVVWVMQDDEIVVRRDGGWTPLGDLLTRLNALTRLGLNTVADDENPFAAKLNKALWTALETDEAGDGDLRMTFNKETASGVVSLLFQSGYAGRAELGLIGDDDLTLKVSADGENWTPVFSVARATGAAVFAKGAVRTETTLLTASGVYAVPAWAHRLEVTVVGAGGGGGSGAVGTAGTHRYGGGGGGAGGVSLARFDVADLTNSLDVVIGGGGAGGLGLGAAGVGNRGVDGGLSSLLSGGLTLVVGAGGLGGAGGGATNGLGGAGGVGAPASNGGGDSAVAASGGAGVSMARPDASGGGGAGGGLDNGNVARAGGAGGQGGALAVAALGGVAASGVAGGAGVSPANPALSWAGGGGGGGSASTSAGLAGGKGAEAAGGGGGGAGATASGAGGAGGKGLVRITAMG